MDDWTQILAARARHGSFVGRGTAQEDAYFAFFADDPAKAPHVTSITKNLARGAKALLAFAKARAPQQRAETG